MRMIHGVLFTAGVLGGTMAIRAQGEQPALQGLPAYGITLSGSPENPIIENHSGRVVIGYSVKLADANGGGMALAVQVMATSMLPAGIPDGGAIYAQGMAPVNSTVPMPSPPRVWGAGQAAIVTAALRNVVFSDGQFVAAPRPSWRIEVGAVTFDGQTTQSIDEPGAFEQFTTKLKAIIEVGMLAKTQAWDQVEALAQAFAQRPQAPPPSVPPTSIAPPRTAEDQVEALVQALEQRLQGLPLSVELPRSVEERILTYFRRAAALRLVQTRKSKGEAAADQLAQIYSSLPTVWK